MMDIFAVRGTTGDWIEYTLDEVEQAVYSRAQNPDLKPIRTWAEEASKKFEDKKPEVLSLLTTALAEADDPFLRRLHEDVEKTAVKWGRTKLSI
jgi:hypothetical protein